MDEVSRSRPPGFAEIPTQQFPVVGRPVQPGSRPPTVEFREPRPSKVEARAVIVYEQEPRRRWGLFVFTGLMVALTIGVILGQTSAYQPPASAGTNQWPPAAAETPSTPPAPAPVTAPLNTAKTGFIDVAGATDLLQLRSADLGTQLFTATAAAGTLTPVVQETPEGPRVNIAVSGPGLVEVLVHAGVRWTVRVSGTANRQDVDLRAGALTELELAGGASYAAVSLPAPQSRARVRVTGAIGDLRVAAGGAPSRLRLNQGASAAVLDESARQEPKPGTTLSAKGWKAAKKRYDVIADVRLGTVTVTTSEPGVVR